MADDEHDEHRDAASDGESPKADAATVAAADAAASANDVLAVAEEAAAREAEAEAAEADGPKVVRPRARTSRKANGTAESPAVGAAPVADSVPGAPAGDVTVIPPTTPASAGRAFGTESLTIRQGGLEEANARTIDISQGGIGRARADDIAISQGGIGFARGDRVSVEMGGIGAAIAGEVRLTQGGAGTILARDVRVEQAGVRTIIANHVHIERTTGVLFLIARRVDGNVRVVLDWRGALAFGAAFGIVVSLFRRRGR
jgi:hypothetical protein